MTSHEQVWNKTEISNTDLTCYRDMKLVQDLNDVPPDIQVEVEQEMVMWCLRRSKVNQIKSYTNCVIYNQFDCIVAEDWKDTIALSEKY